MTVGITYETQLSIGTRAGSIGVAYDGNTFELNAEQGPLGGAINSEYTIEGTLTAPLGSNGKFGVYAETSILGAISDTFEALHLGLTNEIIAQSMSPVVPSGAYRAFADTQVNGISQSPKTISVVETSSQTGPDIYRDGSQGLSNTFSGQGHYFSSTSKYRDVYQEYIDGNGNRVIEKVVAKTSKTISMERTTISPDGSVTRERFPNTRVEDAAAVLEQMRGTAQNVEVTEEGAAIARLIGRHVSQHRIEGALKNDYSSDQIVNGARLGADDHSPGASIDFSAAAAAANRATTTAQSQSNNTYGWFGGNGPGDGSVNPGTGGAASNGSSPSELRASRDRGDSNNRSNDNFSGGRDNPDGSHNTNSGGNSGGCLARTGGL